ncbi:MAG TPA: selenocysteine-specific translation elongation factor [Terriglobales bacterium]|jgi:selenocysteine-specific elongation factor|nr:selenocysteine-specific translation elongation factor [Terriglobales bacterium]
MKSVIVGTAGHIDHGKTALVKALTGIDADRLEEEKRRGITIDLGFAHLELPGPGGERLRLGFVDVPGHERFVRNMLAGVGGIDVVLLVIAADEGIKPQTREHFDICRLLSIRRGLTVLTKADLVDRETLEVVRLEVGEFLRGSFLDPASAPIVPVSALTGAGLDDLKRELARVAALATAKDSASLFRLPIDRVFTMKGFGTVVTGTLVSGTVRKEEEVELFPAGRRVRVRGIQVHNAPAEQAVAGERTALNLAGVEKDQLARGMTLAAPGLFRSAHRMDVSLALLPSARPLKDRSRVHFHAYTAETVAEVVLYGERQLEPGGSGYAQLRLAETTLLLPGDRFILRQFSPVVTIGGGVVLDGEPLAKQDGRVDFLATLAAGDPGEIVVARLARRGLQGLDLRDLAAETGWTMEQAGSVVASLHSVHRIVRHGDHLTDVPAYAEARKHVQNAIGDFHARNPLVAGISKEDLRTRCGIPVAVFQGVLDALLRQQAIEISGEQVRLAGRGVVLKDEEAEAKQIIERAFSTAGLKVPFLKDVLASLPVDRARAQKIVTLLLRDKVLVKLTEELAFHRDALVELRRMVAAAKASTPKLNVAQFKDLTGITRKYAIPLLEWLDRERVTRRVGDERVIL